MLTSPPSPGHVPPSRGRPSEPCRRPLNCAPEDARLREVTGWCPLPAHLQATLPPVSRRSGVQWAAPTRSHYPEASKPATFIQALGSIAARPGQGDDQEGGVSRRSLTWHCAGSEGRKYRQRGPCLRSPGQHMTMIGLSRFALVTSTAIEIQYMVVLSTLTFALGLVCCDNMPCQCQEGSNNPSG